MHGILDGLLVFWVGVTDLIEHKIVTDTYLQQLYYGTLFLKYFSCSFYLVLPLAH